MATATMVPLEEYLRTSYDYDREWIRGEVKERSMPDGYHGYFEAFLSQFFNLRRQEFGLRALTEVRLRVSAASCRVPDVQLIPLGARFLPLPVEVPVVCIEILSPDDRIADLEEKIDDYVALGVSGIWILDPRRRTMSVADAEGIRKVREFRVNSVQPGKIAAAITAAELFAELDELEAQPS